MILVSEVVEIVNQRGLHARASAQAQTPKRS